MFYHICVCDVLPYMCVCDVLPYMCVCDVLPECGLPEPHQDSV